jgi:outer membrane receptor for ferrienterochelin and colicins
MKKYAIFVLLLIFAFSNLVSKEIKGRVLGFDQDDQRAPLQGAAVRVLDHKQGAITDDEGEFAFEVPSAAKFLIITYIGYHADTVAIETDKEFYEIALQNDSKTTENVVVNAAAPDRVKSVGFSNIETITSRGLKKAACCNLGESFITNPSVDVEFTDAVTGAKQIQLLGLHGTYSQILTEKIPNLRGLASVYGLNYIPGSWMESISISKGTSTVESGYESITGQINVEYKKPEDSEKLFLNFYGDQISRFEGNFNSTTKLGDGVFGMLLGHANIHQHELDVNNDSFLDHPLVNQVNFMGRLRTEGDIHESRSGVKVLYEDRIGGQRGFDLGNNPNNLYGIDIQTQRYEAFTKNGFVFDTERYHSIGTIAAFTHHKQNSVFGARNYDAEQNSVYMNLIYHTDFDLFTAKEESCCPHDEESASCSPSGKQDHDSHEHSEDCQHDDDSDDHAEHEDHSDHAEHEEEEPQFGFAGGVSYQYDNYLEKLENALFDRNESVPGVYGELKYKGISDFVLVAGLRADFHSEFGTFYSPRAHASYKFAEKTMLRASAGKGFHISNIISENVALLASSREFVVQERLRPEEAWNYGINFTHDFVLFNWLVTANVDFYRTEFINQVITDIDQDATKAIFYNLDGESYSNSFQADIVAEVFTGMVITAAYRMNDVKMTIDGELRDKPLSSKHKGFINFAYSLFGEDEWMFDFTVDIKGGGRLPNTSMNPEEYQLGNRYDGFTMLHAQITKSFDYFDIYLGAENLTDYIQPNPVLAADDPWGAYFDSSIVWGPLVGRKIYMGVRYEM